MHIIEMYIYVYKLNIIYTFIYIYIYSLVIPFYIFCLIFVILKCLSLAKMWLNLNETAKVVDS